MEKNVYPTIAIALLLLMVTVGGELLIITSDHDDFYSGIEVNGDRIDVTVDPHGSHSLSILSLIDTYDRPENVYIYYDETYESIYNNVKVAVGARPLDQESYVQQVKESLRVRDISNVNFVNAIELSEIMSKNGKDVAVVCVSGALPDTVYNGTSESSILDWISSGGRFYWIGNTLGKYISHQGSLETVINGVSLFFGTECIDENITESYDKYYDNGLTESLSIINNNTRYSPRVSDLPITTDYIGFGYTDGERYSSIVIGHGSGSICIVGGDYSDYQRIDLTQIIASGISPTSKLIDSFYESAHGKKTVTVEKGDTIYVCLGGDLEVYGKLHEVA